LLSRPVDVGLTVHLLGPLTAALLPNGDRTRVAHLYVRRIVWVSIVRSKSIKWVAEALGHADPTLTLRTYTHVLDAAPESMDFVPGAKRARNAPGSDLVGIVSS